jgi:hypothetical protein
MGWQLSRGLGGNFHWNTQGVPKLEGITHCPYFHEGNLIQDRGYHSDTGSYLSRDFNIEVRGSVDNALKSLEYLKGVIVTFPFESVVDEAVALAMMLTAVQRRLLECVPMFAISANTPGSGKTMLQRGISSLMTGTAPSVCGYRSDEKEFTKMLFSLLLGGASAVAIDNVGLGVPFGGDDLCSMLSSLRYQDRELSFSRIREVSTRALFSVSGNNLRVSQDMTRRCLMIRLDPKCEKPEERVFDEDFVTLCLRDRKKILQAVLTILRGYHEAGCPNVGQVRLGTFEEWSDAVCAPLMWLGVVDPALGLAKSTADTGISDVSEILGIWFGEIGPFGVTVKELFAGYSTTAGWFRELFADGPQGTLVRKVGNFLSKYEGRVVGGKRLVRSGLRGGVAVWRVEI